MTTHEGHDHPNTKAARAACRRAQGSSKMTDHAGKNATRGKPKASTGRKVTEPINTAAPHAYDEDMERPGRCYVCKLTPTARVHIVGAV